MTTDERESIARELERLRDKVAPFVYRYVNKRTIAPEDMLAIAARAIRLGREVYLEDLAMELPKAQRPVYKRALLAKVREIAQRLADRMDAWYERNPEHKPRLRITVHERKITIRRVVKESHAA